MNIRWRENMDRNSEIGIRWRGDNIYELLEIKEAQVGVIRR